TNTGTFNAPTTTNYTSASAANLNSASATFNKLNIFGTGPFNITTFNATATALTIASSDTFAGGSGVLALTGTTPLTNTGTFNAPTTTNLTSGSGATAITSAGATFNTINIYGSG